MAGMGVDAMIMDETDPELKAKIGSAAYFIAAGKALGRLPMDMHGQGRRPARTVGGTPCSALIGNVGELTGNITLIPERRARRRPARRLRRLAAPLHPLAPGLLPADHPAAGTATTRSTSGAAGGSRSGCDGPDNYQLDGDVAGECRTLVAEVQPGALHGVHPVGAPEATAADLAARTVS